MDQTQAAYSGAVKSGQQIWSALSEQTRKLDFKTPQAQLEQMKTKMRLAADQAGTASQKQVDAARDEWKRLDLAERVQQMQSDSEQKLKDLDESRKAMSKDLDAANKAYADAQLKLQQARTAYDEAAKRADSAWNALNGK